MVGSLLRVLDRRALLALAAALAILLAVVVVATYRLRAFETATEWVDHTHEVIEGLEVAAHRLTDAESAQRGYLISSNSGYREEYRRSAGEVPRLIERVRALTRDNPQQQRRLDTLATLADARIAQLEETIRASDAAGIPAAQVLVAEHLRHPLMQQFDALIDRLVRSERELLAARATDRAARLARLSVNIKLGAALAMLVALVAAVRAQRAAAQRAVAEHDRDAKANEVASQAAELSAQNQELVAQGEALRVAMDLAEGANEAKSVFLAQMSHELRTPLNSVIGFANIVRRNPRGALLETELTYLDRIVENGRHLLRTINSILDLSKIEARQETVDLERVALPELAREVLASLETQAAAGAVTLRLDAPATLASITTDPDKMRRVLINLVANAVKFTKSGGTVTIRIETSGRAPAVPIAIEVRDTGVGIAPNRLAAIFEAFEQGDVGVGREYGGTGLGLSISRALCRLLQYELTVDSTLGEGSTFRVALERSADAIRKRSSSPGSSVTMSDVVRQ